MMKLCESHDCTNWCQWRISGETESGRKEILKLCQRHKIEAMAHPLLKNQTAVFCGVIPDMVGSK